MAKNKLSKNKKQAKSIGVKGAVALNRAAKFLNGGKSKKKTNGKGIVKADSEPGFTYKEDPAIKALANRLSSMGEFSYDLETDPIYKAAAARYRKMGEDAAENVIGEVASNTGGLASSWAASAAQMAQNDYNNRLAELGASYRDAAYDRHQNELANNLNTLSALSAIDSERKNFAYNIYNNDRAFQEDRHRDKRDYKYNVRLNRKNYNYTKGRDKVGDRQWATQMGYNVAAAQMSPTVLASVTKRVANMSKSALPKVKRSKSKLSAKLV